MTGLPQPATRPASLAAGNDPPEYARRARQVASSHCQGATFAHHRILLCTTPAGSGSGAGRLARELTAAGPQHGRGGSALPPVEHAERAEGVPAARFPHRTVKREVDPAGMDAVERPAAVRLLL